jgi:cytochrome c biogenesis protein CcmG, thiol:disulfide interchange protein DsbE
MNPALRAGRVALALAIVAAMAAACGGEPSGRTPRNGVRATNAPGAAQASPSAGSASAPLLPSSPTELPQFTPAMFRELLGQLRGTPVLVNVWASWCGPCRVEGPHLSAAAKEFDGRVQFLGVDIQDQIVPARGFVQEFGWPYPSVFDPTGAIRDDLGFVGQPVTVVYDREGEQVFVWSGAISEEKLTAELNEVVRL